MTRACRPGDPQSAETALSAALRRYAPTVTVQQEDDGWSVEFPNMPGCVAAGDTIEEAVALALDAAEAWALARAALPASTESGSRRVDVERLANAYNNLIVRTGVGRGLSMSLWREIVAEYARLAAARLHATATGGSFEDSLAAIDSALAASEPVTAGETPEGTPATIVRASSRCLCIGGPATRALPGAAALPATDPAGLDAAWAEAGAALPDGYYISNVRSRSPGGRWSASATLHGHETGANWSGFGDTPSEALRALAARLRQETPDREGQAG